MACCWLWQRQQFKPDQSSQALPTSSMHIYTDSQPKVNNNAFILHALGLIEAACGHVYFPSKSYKVEHWQHSTTLAENDPLLSKLFVFHCTHGSWVLEQQLNQQCCFPPTGQSQLKKGGDGKSNPFNYLKMSDFNQVTWFTFSLFFFLNPVAVDRQPVLLKCEAFVYTTPPFVMQRT